jgi:hypothetical protein
VLITALVCISLHEGGHALAGWATGAQLTKFDVLSLRPNVEMRGPSSPEVDALRATAGSALMVAMWFVAMVLVPLGRGRFVLPTVSCFAGMEVLGWFLSAAVHPWQPQVNDAGLFLNLSGMNPFVAVVVCITVASAGWLLFQTRERRVLSQVFPV